MKATAPWVEQVGTITCCPHGKGVVSGWSFNFMRTPKPWPGVIEVEDLVDRLVMIYPDCVIHEAMPKDCSDCLIAYTFS